MIYLYACRQWNNDKLVAQMTEGKLTQSDHQCRVRNNMSKVNSHPHHQNHHDAICMSSLSLTGYIWALLSLCGVMATALGFFMPFWLQGEMSPQFNNTVSYLGIFRRCYYPAISSDNGEIMIVSQCGHYSRFSDIPSVWWQVTTILVGISACLSFVISLISLLAVCLDDVLTKTSACIMGAVQFMAGNYMTCDKSTSFNTKFDTYGYIFSSVCHLV